MARRSSLLASTTPTNILPAEVKIGHVYVLLAVYVLADRTPHTPHLPIQPATRSHHLSSGARSRQLYTRLLHRRT